MILFIEKLRVLLRRLLGWQEVPPPVPEAPVPPPPTPPPEPLPEPQIVIAETIPKVPPRPRRRYTTRNLERERTINWLLEFMTKGKPGKLGTDIPIDYFDGADPIFGDERDAALGNDGDTLYCVSLLPTKFEKFDVSILSGAYENKGISLCRCRKADLRFVRGIGALASQIAVELSIATVTEEFLYEGWHAYFTWTGRKGRVWNAWAPVLPGTMMTRIRSGRHMNWIDLKSTALGQQYYDLAIPKEDREEWTTKIQLSLGAVEVRRLNWRVLLGFDGHPRIGFRTDPVGVREVFRLRDIPEGKKRRAALRHWVRDHWRTPVSAEENRAAMIHVREHLRGETQFHWNGLSCSIIPSEIDRTRNLEEITQPAVLQVTG
jgi:hypothetical protein